MLFRSTCSVSSGVWIFQELIDTGANASRHVMHVNAEGYHSKLTVLLVNESDAGIYSCSAVFHIGASEGHVGGPGNGFA